MLLQGVLTLLKLQRKFTGIKRTRSAKNDGLELKLGFCGEEISSQYHTLQKHKISFSLLVQFLVQIS